MLARVLAPLAPPLCWSCSAPAPVGMALCRACARDLRHLPSEPIPLGGVPCFSAVAYEGAARELVRALKFRAALGVAGPMAAAIAANAPAGHLSRAALVPVPLSPGRARRRGFNQAHVLALALARRSDCRVVNCLERRESGTQVGRDRAERTRALAGAIRASLEAAGLRRAVLVDDVATTGATLAASADALHAGGCGRVLAVTYARTLGR